MSLRSRSDNSSLPMGLPAIASLTRVDLVEQAILEHIFNGTFKPGQRLVEAALAKQLGVSQGTVNSALQDLHAQGIVTKVLNRATKVSRYGRAEIEDMFKVRMILEPAAVEAAAVNLNDEGLRRLENHYKEMRQAAERHDLSRFCLADYGFHQTVVALSKNRFLIQACQAIAAAPFAYILCECNERLPTDYISLADDHLEIVEALKLDPRRAADLVRQKVSTWHGWSVDALAKKAAGEADSIDPVA